ncbi:hypothetical protein TNCV_85821 [Trichonephila clavipes]|nr:hypothetical protein TNCV_85821 [Trichonephila clavipes]
MALAGPPFTQREPIIAIWGLSKQSLPLLDFNINQITYLHIPRSPLKNGCPSSLVRHYFHNSTRKTLRLPTAIFFHFSSRCITISLITSREKLSFGAGVVLPLPPSDICFAMRREADVTQEAPRAHAALPPSMSRATRLHDHYEAALPPSPANGAYCARSRQAIFWKQPFFFFLSPA